MTAYFLQRAAEATKSKSTLFYHNAKVKYEKDIKYFISTKHHLKSIQDFANEFGFNVKFWNKFGRNKSPILAGQYLTFMPRGVVNISTPHSNACDGLVLSDCSLITDWMKYSNADRQKTIIEALADVDGLSKKAFNGKWESDRISFFEERKFYETFGIGFEVFTRSKRKNRHYQLKLIHRSLFDKCLFLEFTSGWLSNKSFISIHDKFLLSERPKHFYCETPACGFATDREERHKNHIEKCTGLTVTKYKQIKLTRMTAFELLIHEGYIDSDYIPTMFVSYDIETINDKSGLRKFGVTRELSKQRLLSISVTKNFGENRTYAFRRDDSTEKSYFELLQQFKSHLFEIHNEFNKNLPQKLKDSFDKVKAEISENRKSEPAMKMPFQRLEILNRCMFELKRLLQLPVVGFNSEHFDLPILLPGLLRIWGIKSVDTIRRGTGVMIMRLEPFVFIDARNFSAGSSLIKFGKAWGANTNKSIFPYEAFNTISELSAAENWPPYSKFFSSLSKQKIENFTEKLVQYLNESSLNKDFILSELFGVENIQNICNIIPNSVCPVEYIQNYLEYTKMKESGVINNMYDYLLFYNKKDTELLTEAFENYINAFITTFGLSPLDYYSLPGMAEQILWKNYDQNINEAYSLPNFCADVNQLIRDNLQGGLVAVFHRHAEVKSTNSEMAKAKV